MDEYMVKRALTSFINAGVPAGTSVLNRVMTRAEARKPARRLRPGVVLALAVAAAASIAAAVGVSAGAINFPIHLNLLPDTPHVGVINKLVASGGATAATKVEAVPTTIAAAQAAFGHRVLTAGGSSGASLQRVYFNAAAPVPAEAKPGQQPTPAAVSLEYAYAGTTVSLRETFDSSGAPLTVDAINLGGPQSKGPVGLGPVDIETVGGSAYGVTRTTVGGPVEALTWKTASGIVVTAMFDAPVSATTAFALAASLG